MKNLLILTSLIVSSLSLQAKLALDQIYSPHMVLQREVMLPIRGYADPGAKVQVKFGNQVRTASTDPSGRWEAWVDPMPAGGPYVLLASTGAEKVELPDILVGDVWLAGGQSNMEWILRLSLNGEEVARGPQPSNLRLCKIQWKVAETPVDDIQAKWATSSEVDAVRSISGVGYFFARAIAEKTNVPIGLLNASKGASPAEAWMRIETLSDDPEFVPILTRWAETLQKYPETIKAWEADAPKREEALKKAQAEAVAAGKPVPGPVAPPPGPGHYTTPAGLWNGVIHPLTKLPIKGVIWYQGESNRGRSVQYQRLFPTLILDWRHQWNCGEFPFYWVQLANFDNYRPPVTEPQESEWAEMREAQALALPIPNTGMISAIDLGAGDTIHPLDKKSVGDRLAAMAMNRVYGAGSVLCDDPRFRLSRYVAGGVEIEFSNVGKGLAVRGGGKLLGFAVAGDDRKFIWTEAEITSPKTVLVKRPDGMAKIASVRYRWMDNPPGNLVNSADLPAEPFRTDCWSGLTNGKR